MKVLFSCGETSGRLIVQLVLRGLEASRPDIRTVLWSPRPRAGGVFGFTNGLRLAPILRHELERAMAAIRSAAPGLVVLSGFSGFHLRLGRECRRRGIEVLFLAPPQVWAWGSWRLRLLRQSASSAVCLFPFEAAALQRRGLDAVFLGHPLVDLADSVRTGTPDGSRADNEVVLMPGSRSFERQYHEPLFRELADRLRQGKTRCRAVVFEAPPENGQQVELARERYAALTRAACAVVVSGTASVEAALLGAPQLVTYHLPGPDRLLAKLLARTRYFAMPNVLLERPVVPEVLEPTQQDLHRLVLRLLADEAGRQRIQTAYEEIRSMLGPPGATARIAAQIVRRAEG